MGEENGEESEIMIMTKEQRTELLEAKTIEINKIYMEQLKQTLEAIEEVDKKPDKDRLTYANMINHLVGVLIGSIQGWQKWCNLNSMDTLLSLDEMKDIVPKMKRLVKEWIEMDIDITKIKTADIEKEYGEKKAKGKTSKPKSYVS